MGIEAMIWYEAVVMIGGGIGEGGQVTQAPGREIGQNWEAPLCGEMQLRKLDLFNVWAAFVSFNIPLMVCRGGNAAGLNYRTFRSVRLLFERKENRIEAVDALIWYHDDGG